MLDQLQRVNWEEYLTFLLQGHPSVGLQLLALNAALLAYWLVRRARKRKFQQSSTWLLQLLFVAGNIGVVTFGSRLSL